MHDVRPSVVLATSNGTGMGHLARAAATALALDGRLDPVVFSLSQALPLVTQLGLDGEYCPGPTRAGLPSALWQQYLADRICALIAETNARVFAFDGAWPYAGIHVARSRLPHVAFVWVRRGMWKLGANQRALAQRTMFDRVLEPGELARQADQGATAVLNDATRVGPITLLEQVSTVSRAEAAAHLGLDPERPTALITLRADALDDDSAASAAVRAVLADPDWQVALTRSPLAASDLGRRNERVVLVRGVFPLARYLSAFDIAVTEAGYNSFHEMLLARLPSVFVPTRAAVTDDQGARARWAAEAGLAFTAAEDDPAQVGAEARKLLDPHVRAQLTQSCATLPAPSGASAAADLLCEWAGSFGEHRFTLAERARTARLHLRPLALRALSGARARGPAPRVTDSVSADDLQINPPPEHLIGGASSTYRRTREHLAKRYARFRG